MSAAKSAGVRIVRYRDKCFDGRLSRPIRYGGSHVSSTHTPTWKTTKEGRDDGSNEPKQITRGDRHNEKPFNVFVTFIFIFYVFCSTLRLGL